MIHYNISFSRINDSNYHGEVLLSVHADNLLVGYIRLANTCPGEAEVEAWEPTFTPVPRDLARAIRSELQLEAQRQGQDVRNFLIIN